MSIGIQVCESVGDETGGREG